ncbi:Hypothetical predicted protein, partial [Paramuricea clavata]
ILACGDVHPNPVPALSSSRKQVGAKLNSLRALYLNARSLKATAESTDKAKKTSKLTILQNLVYLEQYDIVCVCETWLNELILDNEILPGYTIHRKDRHGNMRGGGVLVAVRNELRSSRRLLEDQQSEHLMIELYPANCSKFLLSLFYGPPNSEEDILIEQFQGGTFCEIITDQFLYQKAVGPTHLRGNKLDCVFSNSPKLITNVNCTNPTDLFPTDHYLIELDIKDCFQKAKSIRRTVYDFNNANFDGAREHLVNVPLDSAISDNSYIDECWKAWTDLFLTAIDKFVSKKTVVDTNTPPWIDRDVKHMIKKKYTALRQYRQKQTEDENANSSSSKDVNLNMTPKTEEITFDIQISQNEVEQSLNHLDTTKAYGQDGIPPRLLKEFSREISTSLCSLFNMSLTTGRLPMEWKHANVIPIHKKDCVESVTNYRPISLLPITFTPLNRSCKNLDQNKQIDVLYLDFSKAVDSVDHDIILHKLQMHGINGTLLRWFENYLNDIWQRVVIDGAASTWSPVTSGVPQGSILGPTNSALYADDSKLYREIKSVEDCQFLQDDLAKLEKWSTDSKMRFNTEKCKVLTISRKQHPTRFPYRIYGNELSPCQVEKDLGMLVTSNLKWGPHILKMVAEANKMLGILKRSCFDINHTQVRRTLYLTLVKSQLDCGSEDESSLTVFDNLCKRNQGIWDHIKNDEELFKDNIQCVKDVIELSFLLSKNLSKKSEKYCERFLEGLTSSLFFIVVLPQFVQNNASELNSDDSERLKSLLVLMIQFSPQTATQIWNVAEHLANAIEDNSKCQGVKYLVDLGKVLAKKVSGFQDVDTTNCKWNELPTIPTEKEILAAFDLKSLEAIKRKTPYTSTEEYLDINYRLLREECFRNLCDGIQNFRENQICDAQKMKMY